MLEHVRDILSNDVSILKLFSLHLKSLKPNYFGYMPLGVEIVLRTYPSCFNEREGYGVSKSGI